MLKCVKCNTNNPSDIPSCNKCGAPLDEVTNIIEFDVKPVKIIADRYEIIEQVGAGGMGYVYKAKDKRLNRIVALKTLKFDQKAIADNIELQMMIQEAQATARLNHSNIVTVYDVVIDSTPSYIAMEFIEGKTLSELMSSKSMKDLNEIIEVIIQICDGITHAHDKGIIHRDLKPQNIMLVDKKVKITDFGIAKIVEDMERTLTERGGILGTPPYMAPERFTGGKADPRWDIFAIGVIMYEFLAKVRPFNGNTYSEIISMILYQDYIPIKELNPSVPDFLELVVKKALEKSPERRFQKVSMIKETLEEFRTASLNKLTQHIDYMNKQPTIWNIPYHRNTNFTGREDILQKMHSELSSGKPASKVLTLHGLGGIGKTQLALEYSYRYGIDSKDYDIVWWIRSEMPSTLSADFTALAVLLKLPKENLEEHEIVTIVRNWLEQNTRWLLVFDNAEDPSEISKTYLPISRTGNVIITSLNPNWRGIATTLPVTGFNNEESIELLGKWTGEEDAEGLKELSKVLGNIPLAISQAGAYITETGSSVNDYLELFKERQEELLKLGIASPNYNVTVAATWEISFEKIKQESPAGAELMNLCAFLAPDDIPLSIFRGGRENLPESLRDAASDRIKFDKAIAAILRYSMATRKGDAISIHKLVQIVVQDKLTIEEKRNYIRHSIELLIKAFPESTRKIKMWPDCERLLPHIIVSTNYAEVYDVALEPCGALIFNSGAYLLESRKLTEAKNAIERALKIREKIFGQENLDVAENIFYLGSVNIELGVFKKAKEQIEKSLEIREKILGTEHPDVAESLNTLGWILLHLSDFKEARKLVERALKMREKIFGLENPDVGYTLNTLGWILLHQGELDESRKLVERALSIFEKNYGEDHPFVTYCLNSLGRVNRDLGNFKEARNLMERALKIREKTFGENHPFVAYCLNNLGWINRDLGELTLARNLTERALRIREKSLPPDHQDVSISLDNLGNILMHFGEFKEAKKLIERALIITEKTFGENHPDVASSLNKLGLIHKHLGELKEARNLTEKALKIREKSLDPEHPSVAESLHILAMILHNLGESIVSREHLERAIEIGEKKLKPDHFTVGKYLYDYASILEDLGEIEKAKEQYKRAYEIYSKTFGENHPKTHEVKKLLDELQTKIDKSTR